jgi:hypothetical protein
MRALRQCDSGGGGGGGGYGSYLCTRHRRDATVSSAVLRSPRRVAEGGRQSRPIPRSVLVEPKIPLITSTFISFLVEKHFLLDTSVL